MSNDALTIFHNTVGLVGVGITIVAFFLLNMRKMDARRWPYPAVNALGSLLIMFSLHFAWNLASWVMELSWLLTSLYGVFQALRISR